MFTGGCWPAASRPPVNSSESPGSNGNSTPVSMKTTTRMPGEHRRANSPPSPSQYIGSMMLGRAITAVVVMAHQDTGEALEAAVPGRLAAIGSAMATHKAVHVASAQAP